MVPSLPLFGVDAQVGFGSNRLPDFPSCAELLSHMNRLGVGRTLVWATEARDQSLMEGNRRLLRAVEQADPRGERLVPSLVVGPAMQYSGENMREIQALVSSRRVRALRVCPGALRHRAELIEPVLAPLAVHAPVVLMDVTDSEHFASDARWIAERFSGLPVVCLQAMWPQHMDLFDLMRRCPNVLTDTSWVHTAGTLRYIRDTFGADRMVFGFGPRAHQGAAIGALVHSDLSADEQELVAHGNLERLLGLGCTRERLSSSGAVRSSPLWARLLAGDALGVDIVDAHTHVGLAGYWAVEQDDAKQVRYQITRMDRFGIALALTSGGGALMAEPLAGNRELEASVAATGRFRGYVGFNPVYHERLAPALDSLFASPFFVGFKTLCDYWDLPVTDPRFRPMLEYANAHRLPILYHTWDGPYDSPAMLRDSARAYPEATFLLGHSGGGNVGRREAVELCRENDNVFLEWCGSFCSSVPWEETLTEVGQSRVVFGTDTSAHDIAWELARLLSLDWPSQELVPILGATMRRILALRR